MKGQRLAAQGLARRRKLWRLREAIRNGNYRVSAETLARCLLAALGRPRSKPELLH